MDGTHRLVGRCHCGNVTTVLETAKPPEQLGLRACGCSFCRRHGARTTSDPEGRARIAVRDPVLLSRYRFNLRSADFLVCRECGTYLGAVYADADGAWATLNANAFEERDAFTQTAAPVAYEAETAEQRAARRKRQWTPLEGWR